MFAYKDFVCRLGPPYDELTSHAWRAVEAVGSAVLRKGLAAAHAGAARGCGSGGEGRRLSLAPRVAADDEEPGLALECGFDEA